MYKNRLWIRYNYSQLCILALKKGPDISRPTNHHKVSMIFIERNKRRNTPALIFLKVSLTDFGPLSSPIIEIETDTVSVPVCALMSMDARAKGHHPHSGRYICRQRKRGKNE